MAVVVPAPGSRLFWSFSNQIKKRARLGAGITCISTSSALCSKSFGVARVYINECSKMPKPAMSRSIVMGAAGEMAAQMTTKKMIPAKLSYMPVIRPRFLFHGILI